MTLLTPAGLVLTPAMLQIEHGIALLDTLVAGFDRCTLLVNELSVCRWQVNHSGLHLTQALRVEQYLLDASMCDILAAGIDILVLGRNLDTALPTAGAKVVMSTWVVEGTTVNGQVIVVEALVHRTFCLTDPGTVEETAQLGAALSTQTEADSDSLGIGSLDTEAYITLRIHLRIVLSGLVHH